MKWRCQQRSFAMKYSLPHGQCKDGFYCIGGRERLVYCSRIMGYSATDEVQDHVEGSGRILQRHSHYTGTEMAWQWYGIVNMP